MHPATKQPSNLVTALAIFFLTLATHLAYFFASNGDFYYPDSATYLAPAQNLAHGLGFVNWLHVPETIRTPGYPLFLVPFVLITSSPVPIVLLQHLLDALLAVAVFRTAERWSGSCGVAIAAALLFGFDPATIHYANKVLSETLFTVVFFATFLGAIEARGKRGAILTGLAAGALVLIRPVAILWFLVIAIYFWRRRIVIAFVISALILPVAWGMRNRVKTGVFTIASVAGTNMLMHRAAGALAIMDDYEFPDALRDRQAELLEQAEVMIDRAEHVPDRNELPHAVQAQYFGALGRRIFLQHPIGAVMITLHGIEMNLFDSDQDSMMIVSQVPATIVQMTLDVCTHIEFFLAVIGLCVMWRRDRTLTIFVALTLLYFIVISAGAESEARFRVPFMPLYAIAAAFAISGRAVYPERSEGSAEAQRE